MGTRSERVVDEVLVLVRDDPRILKIWQELLEVLAYGLGVIPQSFEYLLLIIGSLKPMRLLVVPKASFVSLDKIAHVRWDNNKLGVPPVRGQGLLRSQISDGPSPLANLAGHAIFDFLLVGASSRHFSSILS